MITSVERVELSRLSPEVIIVGGGAVGLIAAVYLALRRVRVLVLEAGPESLDPASQSLFELATIRGRKHAGLHHGRFRALGGTTNLWGGQLVRFDRNVFLPRPWVSEVTWPINLDDLEPFYKECEKLLEMPQEIAADREVISRLKLPPEYCDPDLDYFFTRWLTEKNFRFRFDRFLAANDYLTVLTNAPVTSLRLGLAVGEVRGVGIGSRSNPKEVSARHIVLANGTVELIRLLQHPTTSGEMPPWAGNQWLGRGFMDHLEGTIGHLAPINSKLFHRLFDNAFLAGTKLQPRLKLSEACQTGRQLLGAAVHIQFGSQEHLQNAKIFIAGLLRGRFSNPRHLPKEVWAALRLGLPMAFQYLVNRRIWSPVRGGVNLRVMLEHAPQTSSTISLTDDLDCYGMQVPELTWTFSTEEQLKTIRAIAILAKRYFENRGIAEVSLPEVVAEGRPELLESFIDTFHHMGGTRMANSESSGVVDPAGRVFGSRNLHVMGAATFPTSGFANPTFTALALALRTAETIRRDLQ